MSSDLADEQLHLDHAYACLAAMRAKTEHVIDLDDHAATAYDSEVAKAHLGNRLATLDTGLAALCFGRIDHDATQSHESFHVGRRHVEDAQGDPVVIDWRARAATPFYRATVTDPMDLHRRRRFSLDDRTITSILDEVFDDPDSVLAPVGGIPDPLLAELERARTGEMRDIVATIQAEQDVVIRAPADRLLIVQGGPGTGKTAVGLHRAAYLLYEHRERLEAEKLLVIGPNRLFLRYISQVLPSLGERAVTQLTLEGLCGVRRRVKATEGDDLVALKGDLRMATVLRRLLVGLSKRPVDDWVIGGAYGRLTFPAADIAAVVDELIERGTPWAVARDVLRRRLEVLAYQQQCERMVMADPPPEDDFLRHLRANKTWQTELDRLMPGTSAPALVRRLLGNHRARAAAAEGVLGDDEVQALARSSAKKVDDEPWTMADLVLLDEADWLVTGSPTTYGHVVVDEAQDHTAMALRMLARRSPTGAMTVLGDLAQATAPGAQPSWDDATAALASAVRSTPEVEVAELGVGYRVPGAILDFASQVLDRAAPHVRPSSSARVGGRPPSIVPTDDLVSATADEVARLAGTWHTVGVVVPEASVDAVLDALAARSVAAGDGRRGLLDRSVTVVTPPAAKGLEFDAVVVVEPAAVVEAGGGGPAGLRLLYIALTRAVQEASVIHARPLAPHLVV